MDRSPPRAPRGGGRRVWDRERDREDRYGRDYRKRSRSRSPDRRYTAKRRSRSPDRGDYRRDRDRDRERDRDRDRDRDRGRGGRPRDNDRRVRSPERRRRSRSPRGKRSLPTRDRTRSRSPPPASTTPKPHTKDPERTSPGPPKRSAEVSFSTDGDATTPVAAAGENGDEMEGVVDDEEAQMQALMGFGGFGTTKQKKVRGNDTGGVYKNKPTKYRQYMNRPGGFNRALSPS